MIEILRYEKGSMLLSVSSRVGVVVYPPGVSRVELETIRGNSKEALHIVERGLGEEKVSWGYNILRVEARELESVDLKEVKGYKAVILEGVSESLSWEEIEELRESVADEMGLSKTRVRVCCNYNSIVACGDSACYTISILKEYVSEAGKEEWEECGDDLGIETCDRNNCVCLK